MINVAQLLAIIRLEDQLSPAVQQSITALRSLDQATEMTSNQARTLGTRFGVASSELAGIGVHLRLTEAQMRQLTDTTKMTSYQMTLLGRGLSEAGVLALGLTAALGLVVRETLKVGSEFETQMTRVVTLAGATRAQVDEMTKPVLALAEASAIGPSELAKGLYVLMSTGMETVDAMETLRVTSEMTALGMGNMHDTTLAVTGAVFAYRAQNLQAAEAASILIKAVQLGNMEIQDLTPAIARVNPIAAALGVSFQDVAAGIATFTHAGVDSAVAATGMRAMLNNILTDSVKTEKGFVQLSRALGDTSISMANFRQEMKDKGFTTAMVDLMEKVTRAGDEGVSAVGKIFPNIRALTEALFVYKTNGGMVIDMLKDFNNGQNELAIGTAELHKTWQWQWDQMKVSVEKLWISLSTSLLPIFKNLLDILKSLMPAVEGVVGIFNELHGSVQYMILIFLGFIAVLGPAILLIGQFVMALGNIRRAFESWGLVAVIAQTPIRTLGATIFAFLTNPWVLGTAAIIALVGALVYWSKESDRTTQAIDKAIETHTSHIASLRKLQAELDPTVGKHRSLYDIAQSLIKIAPETVGSIGGQVVAYKDLKAAIDRTNEAKMYGLRLQYDAIVVDLARLQKEQRIAIENRDHIYKTISTGIDDFGIDLTKGAFNRRILESMKVSYQLFNIEVDKSTAAFDAARAKEESLHRILSASYDAHVKNKEAIAEETRIAELNTQGSMGQAVAKLQLLDRVRALTEAQRAAIEAGKADSLNAKQIFTQLGAILDSTGVSLAKGLDAEIIGIYLKQLGTATTATKVFAKETEKLEKINEAYARINAALEKAGINWKDIRSLDNDVWAKTVLKAGAAVGDVALVTDIAAKNLQVLKHEFDEAAIAEEKFAKDTITSQNWVAVSIANTAALEIKATGDTFRAKEAAVTAWEVRELNKLNNLSISAENYWKHLIQITTEGAARIAVINEARLNAAEVLNAKLFEFEEKTVADITSLWEGYSAVIFDTALMAGLSKRHAVEAQYTQAEADNRKHANKMIDIVNDEVARGVISVEKGVIETNKIKALAAEKNQALWSIREAKLFDAMIDVVVSSLDKLSKKFGDVAQIALEAWKIIGNTKTKPNPKWTPGGTEPENIPIISTSQKWVVGLSAAAEITNLFVTGTDRASSAVRGLMTGMASGAAIGSMFLPGIGTAIGAVGGAIAGLVSGWNSAGKAAREANKEADKTLAQLRAGLITTYGSLANVDMIGKVLGVSLAGAWGDTTVAGLEHFSKLVDEFEKKMANLQSTLQKYGFTWVDMGGDIQQFFAIKVGGDLVEEFNSLVGAGVKVEKVVRGMSDAVSQYIVDSIRAGTKIPAAMEPIIKKMIELGTLTDEAVKAMLGLANDTMPSLADITAAAERYGLSLDALGPKVMQLSINEAATQIVKDWKILLAAGADINVILSSMNPEVKGMGVQVQALVTQAMQYGLELPSALKPILQAMIDAGLLTDENGKKLEDLSKLTFAADLSKMFDELMKKLGELIETIKTGVVPAIVGIGNARIPSIKIPYHFEEDDGGKPQGIRPNNDGGGVGYDSGTRPTLFTPGKTLTVQTPTPGRGSDAIIAELRALRLAQSNQALLIRRAVRDAVLLTR